MRRETFSLEWPRDRLKFATATRLLDLSNAAAVHVIGEPDVGTSVRPKLMPHSRRMVMNESRNGYPGPMRPEPLAAWKTIRLLLACILLAAIAALLAAGIGTMPHWL